MTSKVTVVLKTKGGTFKLDEGVYALDSKNRLPVASICKDFSVEVGY